MDRGTRVIGRRSVLLAGTPLVLGHAPALRPASAAPPTETALPVPPGNALAFRLIRHGSDIGRHTLTFEPQGDSLAVHVAVDALVTLLSVPIVRYSLRVVETWQDGRLTSLTGETNKNGRHQWVNAQRSGEGLVVLGSQTQRYIAPEPAGSTSYWNKHLLDLPMISLEDGVLLRPIVVEERADSVPLASGGTIAANHYNLSGPFKVDLWYDQADTWASLGLPAADGSYVRYERL
jgi:hypothetical protein